MADQAFVPMDYPAHKRTYRGFLFLVKWGTVFVILTLILMAIFLL
ncbi:MAG TPA: aa3-type cytochrome c oxidase subunit IV [Kaistiaceae bacterium]|nr:aa3-type cytochrome c oxidase subunit IV [Kaistiaceae bacterium]